MNGDLGKDWFYSVNMYQDFDPGTFKIKSTPYQDRTQIYKALLTKKYNNERGEFTAMYKYANSHNVYNYATQSAPFIYVGDGSVKEYGKFKLGTTSYLPIDNEMTYRDMRTGKLAQTTLYDACLNKASEVTLMNSYRFDNGLNWKATLKYDHSRGAMVYQTPMAIIMTHSDNHGLVLPPVIAPTQVVVIPIAQHKPGVLDAAAALKDRLTAAGLRVAMDDSEQSAGWKFAQYEMKGVPLRVEIGPKDMEKEQCCVARRDTGEKTFVPLAGLEDAIKGLLQDVHDNLYNMAAKNLEENTFDMTDWQEVKAMADGKGGLARTKWCGSLECELAMKEKAGVSSRCMPLVQSGTTGKCVMCGKECTTDIYWGVAY